MPAGAKAQKKLLRRRKVKAHAVSLRGLSYLESRSVKSTTLQDYNNRLSKFETWLWIDPCKLTNLGLVDSLVVEYLEEIFDIGQGLDCGVRMVAALKFFHPLLGKGVVGVLPRATRAM